MSINPFSRLLLVSQSFSIVGRSSLLETIAQQITLPRTEAMDLHGLPGVGKTGLWRFIASEAFLARYAQYFLPGIFKDEPLRLFRIYVPFQDQADEGLHPFYHLYHTFNAALASYLEADGKSLITQELPEAAQLTDPDAALESVDQRVRALVNQQVRPIFLLDDFHEAFRWLKPHQINRLSRWREYAPLLLSTERRLEKVNDIAFGSPLFKKLSPIILGPLERDDARTYLRELMKDEAKKFPEADLDYIYELVGGFPYLSLLAGQALWEVRRRWGLLGKPERKLPDELRPLLAGQVAVSVEREFGHWCSLLEDEGLCEFLRERAENDFDSVLAGEPFSVERNQLAALVAYGLIQEADAEPAGKDRVQATTPRFFSELFREYLGRAKEEKAAGGHEGRPVAMVQPELTALQSELYKFLRSRPGTVCTFEDIGRNVWDINVDKPYTLSPGQKRAIHIAISKLRRELQETTGEQIVNMRSLGYRFEPAH